VLHYIEPFIELPATHTVLRTTFITPTRQSWWHTPTYITYSVYMLRITRRCMNPPLNVLLLLRIRNLTYTYCSNLNKHSSTYTHGKHLHYNKSRFEHFNCRSLFTCHPSTKFTWKLLPVFYYVGFYNTHLYTFVTCILPDAPFQYHISKVVEYFNKGKYPYIIRLEW